MREVWTLTIDREGQEDHPVRVFASFQDALRALPGELPKAWAEFQRRPYPWVDSEDRAAFFEWIGEGPVALDGAEVVIESHEVEGEEEATVGPEGQVYGSEEETFAAAHGAARWQLEEEGA